MNSFTYMMIGYALGCMAGCAVMYWAMKIKAEQDNYFDADAFVADHDASDWGCECYLCQHMREAS